MYHSRQADQVNSKSIDFLIEWVASWCEGDEYVRPEYGISLKRMIVNDYEPE